MRAEAVWKRPTVNAQGTSVLDKHSTFLAYAIGVERTVFNLLFKVK